MLVTIFKSAVFSSSNSGHQNPTVVIGIRLDWSRILESSNHDEGCISILSLIRVGTNIEIYIQIDYMNIFSKTS